MDADIVDEQLLHQVENETVATLEPPSSETDDTFMVTCRCCNKNFTFYDLKLHIAEKSTEGYYGCDRCTEIFLLKDDLNNHMLSHLTEDTYHDCVQCDTRSDQTALIEHKKIHTPFKCNYCVEDFTNESELESHINEFHITKRVKTDLEEKMEEKKDAIIVESYDEILATEKPKAVDKTVSNYYYSFNKIFK